MNNANVRTFLFIITLLVGLRPAEISKKKLGWSDQQIFSTAQISSKIGQLKKLNKLPSVITKPASNSNTLGDFNEDDDESLSLDDLFGEEKVSAKNIKHTVKANQRR